MVRCLYGRVEERAPTLAVLKDFIPTKVISDAVQNTTVG